MVGGADDDGAAAGGKFRPRRVPGGGSELRIEGGIDGGGADGPLPRGALAGIALGRALLFLPRPSKTSRSDPPLLSADIATGSSDFRPERALALSNGDPPTAVDTSSPAPSTPPSLMDNSRGGVTSGKVRRMY